MSAELKNAPLLAGWAIAAGAAAVAAGVSYVVIGLSPMQALFIAAILLVVVGIILGLPGRIQSPADAADETVAYRPAPAAPAPVRVVPEAVAPVSAAPAPLYSPAAPGASDTPRRPAGLSAARGGAPDDLKRIKGVGPKLEELCHSLGFYHFDQIANWTADEIAWVDDNLEGFKGRVTRDGWVAQARILAGGGSTEFSERVDKGDVY